MTRGISTGLIAALLLSGAAHAAGGGGGHGSSGEDAVDEMLLLTGDFLPMETLTTTVSQDFRVLGVLQIDAGLQIEDAELRARAIAMRPRLRDAYSAALAEYAGSAYLPGAPPDAVLIGDMLQAATDRTLGEPGADLLLGMVMVHR